MATILSVEEVVVAVRRTDIVIPDPVVTARFTSNHWIEDMPYILGKFGEKLFLNSIYDKYRYQPFVIGWGCYHGRYGYDTSKEKGQIGTYIPVNSAPIYSDIILNPKKDDWFVPMLRKVCWDSDCRVVITPSGRDNDGSLLYCLAHYEQPVQMEGGYYDTDRRSEWTAESKRRHQQAYDDLINKYIWTRSDRTVAEGYKRQAMNHLNDIRLHN